MRIYVLINMQAKRETSCRCCFYQIFRVWTKPGVGHGLGIQKTCACANEIPETQENKNT